MLMERCDLWGMLNPGAKAPPPQLLLFPLQATS